ncbi:MAG: endonuclease [Planctomycetota bacterium]|nr:endonuclease [Planctomycetota bacterium]
MIFPRRTITALVAWVAIGFSACVIPEAKAQIPAGYYDTVDTTSGPSLRLTLHDVIDDHKRFPYSSTAKDTWDILDEADEDPGDSNNILDLYKNTSIPKEGRGNDFYNREHSWPKSYGFPNDNSRNYPYTDCHHLFLCDSRYNSSRSNNPYRMCDATCTEKPTALNNGKGGGTGIHPGNSNWRRGSGSSGAWETWMDRRGDVARALFYLDVRYEGGTHGGTGAAEPDLILTNDEVLIENSKTGNNEDTGHMGMLSVLLIWHEQDPPDDKERRRNDVIFANQGNRNPFIDHPEWVACVFLNDCGTPVDPPDNGPPPGEPWINEIHYDNKGGDKGEFVEIAGPTGTTLDGWRLHGYNGANGELYKSVKLSGSITEIENGMGVKAFNFKGLQNGPSDGIALVDADGSVVEFVSYEGVMTALEGPAVGRTSTDIGVKETNNTPRNQSLQRVGSGKSASDHAWQEPMKNTKGKKNTGQSF